MSERDRTNLKYLYAPMVEKAAGEEAGDGAMVVRYAFTSDKMDEGGDIITRAATEKATEAWREWRNIRLQHNPDRPIGKAIAVGEGDGLAWNQMDVRIDDPQVLPLVTGDDPVLGGASVGIIVNDFEVNEDEEAVERAGFWDPWIITDYTIVEISLVDHPMNYDAKVVGDVTENSRSRVLFRRRDLLENAVPDPAPDTPEAAEEDSMTEEITASEAPEAVKDLSLTDATEPAPEAETPAASDAEQEGGDPDLTQLLSQIAEQLGVIAPQVKALHDTLVMKQEAAPEEDPEPEPDAEEPEDDDVEIADDPQVDDADATPAEEPEAATVEAEAEAEPEDAAPETADPPLEAGLSLDSSDALTLLKAIHDALVGNEAPEPAAEVDAKSADESAEDLVEKITAQVTDEVVERIQSRMRLRPRKSKVAEPEPEAPDEPEPDQKHLSDPKAALKQAVRGLVPQ